MIDLDRFPIASVLAACAVIGGTMITMILQ
jgi:hypothetical protein